MRIRLLLHALDRTGPPMLALTLARWIRREHPEHSIHTVSFRGGPLLGDLVQIGSVHVLTDPE
ncbi:MAG: hypothetical protein M5U19_09520 [Microthrixaceae bacterium]|nr:hypothetical protein [Microthrixaceae bacterium]